MKLTNLILISVCALSLIGCIPKKQTVREAYPVPTPYIPAIPDVQRPVIPADSIADVDPNVQLTPVEEGLLVKAYRLSAESWKQYAIELEQILVELRKMRSEAAPIVEKLLEDIAKINKDAAADLRDIETRSTEPKPPTQ